MSGRIRHFKTRSSKQFCAQKFSCQKDEEACYTCEDCKTIQCGKCNSELHATLGYKNHKRQPLPPPPKEELCEHNCNQDRNYADIHCDNCNLNLCHKCDQELHSGSQQHHKRIPFKKYKERKNNREINQWETDENITMNFGDYHFDATTDEFHTVALDSKSIPRDGSIPRLPTKNHSPGHAVNTEPKSTSSIPLISSSDHTGGKITTDHIGMSRSNLSDVSYTSLPDGSNENSSKVVGNDDLFSNNTSPMITSTVIPDSLTSNGVSNLTDSHETILNKQYYQNCRSFMLVDGTEKLLIDNVEEFAKKLECDLKTNLKVISIFGNTGDGKSYTLNHTFFGGIEVFKTSNTQDSCTFGVWAAYDRPHLALILDTEGMLGLSTNGKSEEHRSRLLAKLFAVSDVVIYRTRAERLPNDMFKFLGNTSEVFNQHFQETLKNLMARNNVTSTSVLGPAVIVFQETTHTEVLKSEPEASVKKQIKQRFEMQGEPHDAYSTIEYVGVRTPVGKPTDFACLFNSVITLLDNNAYRTARNVSIVYECLKAINTRYNSSLDNGPIENQLSRLFRCTTSCASCNVRCVKSEGHFSPTNRHLAEGTPEKVCVNSPKWRNQILNCKVSSDYCIILLIRQERN